MTRIVLRKSWGEVSQKPARPLETVLLLEGRHALQAIADSLGQTGQQIRTADGND